MGENNSVRILLVEDDDVDAMSVERGFRQAKVANEIVRARDGIEALEILRGTPGTNAISKPFIILLDLNMPRLDGFGFLEALRSDLALEDSVVFVLTTSKADQDRARAYGSHIAGYMVKSNAGKSFLDMVELLDKYWRVIELPE